LKRLHCDIDPQGTEKAADGERALPAAQTGEKETTEDEERAKAAAAVVVADGIQRAADVERAKAAAAFAVVQRLQQPEQRETIEIENTSASEDTCPNDSIFSELIIKLIPKSLDLIIKQE
jgi:hypothetical protein